MTVLNQFALLRRIAQVLNYLRPESGRRMVEAAAGRATLEQIEQPYRDWLRDVRLIPEDDRARYTDPNTGKVIVRSINSNI